MRLIKKLLSGRREWKDLSLNLVGLAAGLGSLVILATVLPVLKPLQAIGRRLKH